MRWVTPCCYQQKSLWRKNNSSFVELGISRHLGRRGCQTNGKKYIVRGLQRVDVSLADYGGNSFVNYTNQTKNDIKTQLSDVSVRVTNELVKVEKINTDNSVEVILDLSSATAKAQEGAKKPRGNARSKEQWEAMVEAKKATSERNKALVEATAKQLAEKMFKEGKI